MTEPRGGFTTGLLVGSAVAGVTVWILRGQAVETAERRTQELQHRADERTSAGADERLQFLDPIPAGNGTAFLYDSAQGKVWTVSAEGIKPVQPPKQDEK